jgi:hypothetical protein
VRANQWDEATAFTCSSSPSALPLALHLANKNRLQKEKGGQPNETRPARHREQLINQFEIRLPALCQIEVQYNNSDKKKKKVRIDGKQRWPRSLVT